MFKALFIKIAKKLLGHRLYIEYRAQYLFRDLESPFPLYPHTPFNIDWSYFTSLSNGQNKDNNKTISVRAAYIVSPTQRSGTNFLNHMLNKHPDLSFPSGPNLPDEQCLFTFSEILKEFSYKTVSTWNKWVDGGDPALEKHAKALMGSMGLGMLSYFSQFTKPGSTLLFKTPDAGNLHNFFHMFPESKVIILIRDGRDTVESFSRSWGGEKTYRKMSKRWSKRIDTIREFLDRSEKSGFSDKVLVIKFEDLNANTREEIIKILEFLKVDISIYPWEELGNVPVLGSSSYKSDQDEVHWKPVKKDDKFEPTQKWVNWDIKRKKVFKKTAGKNLINLGYAVNDEW